MTSLNGPGFSISVLNEYRIQVPSTWLVNTDGLYVAAGNNEDDEIDLFMLLGAPIDAHSCQLSGAPLQRIKRRR
ncbi:hypothetical protein CY34DRAFT_799958 [Suillus luteus UH-Slu-Lm8-n1]|uniref:Uncharacterized protein n=1 Tax=Suillus luteus UH-Slu-Lm8-n1 TaxID=930992 RepID=A0A0D0BAP4_9AGAM|nr:hypothetical protein CY34DRAFT_799958 [Suillus luteus UH-Slu-Lm8-n1]